MTSVYVPVVVPPDDSIITDDEWLGMSDFVLTYLWLVDEFVPDQKVNTSKLRDFLFIEVKK